MPALNAILTEADALPQLVDHDGLGWHIHAVPQDAPLATRMAVEAAMALIDVVRAGELDRLKRVRPTTATTSSSTSRATAPGGSASPGAATARTCAPTGTASGPNEAQSARSASGGGRFAPMAYDVPGELQP